MPEERTTCGLTRSELTSIVIEVIKMKLQQRRAGTYSVRLKDKLWDDWRFTKENRRRFWGPIRDRVVEKGGRFRTGIGPSTFMSLKTVEEVRDTVWKAIEKTDAECDQ